MAIVFVQAVAYGPISSFDVHINEIYKKVIGMLMYISRMYTSMNFDKSSRIIVVQSSITNYCIRIWGTTNATLIQKVQRLQNFAVRSSAGGLKRA